MELATENEGTPLVSVIIPTRNYAHYLPDAIASVRKQTHPNIELIIVDDESTDNTAEIAKALGVRYLYTKHVGPRNPSNAQNVGIRQSRGDFIVCLAADDMLEPNYIEECLQKFKPNTGFVWTGRQEFGDSHLAQTPNLKSATRKFLFPDPGGALGAMMVRRAAYQKVGLYDLTMKGGEDWDMAIRLKAAGYEGVPILKLLHVCRIHGQCVGDVSTLIKKYPQIKAYSFIDRLTSRILNPSRVLRNIEYRITVKQKLVGDKRYEKLPARMNE